MGNYVIVRRSIDTDELYHHGTKGQKWGKRLYQNKDGSLTALGRLRYGSGDGKSGSGSSVKSSTKKKVSRKVRKQREKALEKAREAKAAKAEEKKKQEEEQKAYEEGKQKALKSGNATDVLKYKGDLTPQEMQSAINRIRWEQDMANISAKEVTAGKSKADEFFKSVNTVTGYANTAFKAWNTIANVHNALNTNGMWPKIDTDIAKGNRGEYKKFKDAAKKRAAEEAQKEPKQKERAEKKAKKQAEEQSKKEQTAKDQNNTSDKKQKKNTKTEPEVERYEATGDDIIGEGKSRFTGWDSPPKSSSAGKSTVDLFESEWSERSFSDLPSGYITTGQTFLLEDKSGR